MRILAGGRTRGRRLWCRAGTRRTTPAAAVTVNFKLDENVGKLGGVFRVTDGLQKDFGEARVIDTPLAESGIVGTAIGLALRRYRPVCEIQFDASCTQRPTRSSASWPRCGTGPAVTSACRW